MSFEDSGITAENQRENINNLRSRLSEEISSMMRIIKNDPSTIEDQLRHFTDVVNPLYFQFNRLLRETVEREGNPLIDLNIKAWKHSIGTPLTTLQLYLPHNDTFLIQADAVVIYNNLLTIKYLIDSFQDTTTPQYILVGGFLEMVEELYQGILTQTHLLDNMSVNLEILPVLGIDDKNVMSNIIAIQRILENIVMNSAEGGATQLNLLVCFPPNNVSTQFTPESYDTLTIVITDNGRGIEP